MSKLIDLTGQRFGRLTVIERAGSTPQGDSTWVCDCDCGNRTIIRGHDIRRGMTKSCGCLKNELSAARVKARGKSHIAENPRLYNIWCGMKTRCYNKRTKRFSDYGGRGITVCAEWLHDFPAFRDWSLSHGYADDLTIDRIDNDKGYSPDNCQWVTMAEQSQNKRTRPKKSKTE